MLKNSLRKIKFCKKKFVLADISIKMILGIHFLSLSNIDVKFAKKPRKILLRSSISL